MEPTFLPAANVPLAECTALLFFARPCGEREGDRPVKTKNEKGIPVIIKIEDEIAKMGYLKNTAGAIVDYVRAVSRGSDFQHYNEWTLEPDNWILLRFSYTSTKTVAITMGVPLERLPDTTGIKADTGHWRNRSRLYLKRAGQLPGAFRCIEYAYYYSSNKYRKRHGFPEKPKAAV